jgi:hypothetical protein
MGGTIKDSLWARQHNSTRVLCTYDEGSFYIRMIAEIPFPCNDDNSLANKDNLPGYTCDMTTNFSVADELGMAFGGVGWKTARVMASFGMSSALAPSTPELVSPFNSLAIDVSQPPLLLSWNFYAYRALPHATLTLPPPLYTMKYLPDEIILHIISCTCKPHATNLHPTYSYPRSRTLGTRKPPARVAPTPQPLPR